MKQKFLSRLSIEMFNSFNKYYVQWADTSLSSADEAGQKKIYEEALELLESWRMNNITNFYAVNGVLFNVYSEIKEGFEKHGIHRLFKSTINKVYGTSEITLYALNFGGKDG